MKKKIGELVLLYNPKPGVKVETEEKEDDVIHWIRP